MQYRYFPIRAADLSSFFEEERRLMDLVITAVRYYQSSDISEITNHLSLWKDADNGDIISEENLILSDHELDKFESFLYYPLNIKYQKDVPPDIESDPDSIVSYPMIKLQLHTFCESV